MVALGIESASMGQGPGRAEGGVRVQEGGEFLVDGVRGRVGPHLVFEPSGVDLVVVFWSRQPPSPEEELFQIAECSVSLVSSL